MFDKVKGITVRGGFYENESTSLGNILSHRMNVVFGRNGSGKSSIARAFAEQKKDGPHSYQIGFCGDAPLPETGDKGIFVFNEDFIDNNVKIDRIRSIVMFGKNIQLDDQIKAAKEELKGLKTSLDAKSGEVAGLSGSVSVLKKTIEDSLRKGYVARLGKIEGGEKRLSSKIFDTVVAIDGTDVTVPLSDHIMELEGRIAEYLSCSKGDKVAHVPGVVFPDISNVNTMLARTVKPAELTEEESIILSVLSGDLASGNYIEKTQRVIIDGDRDFCPLCHQGIDHGHKDMLARRLLRFKDKQVDDFKAEITGAIRRLGHVDVLVFPVPAGSDPTAFQDLSAAVERLNVFIDEIGHALQSKLGNPYAAAASIDEMKYASLCREVSRCIDNVNDVISNYNEKISKVKDLRRYIDELNTRLAYREAESAISSYKDSLRKAAAASAEVRALNDAIAAKEGEIRQMQAQTDKIGTAMKSINAYLRIVFGKDRLTLKSAGNDRYSIYSRGREISPRALSVGERNAIALAYFFACVVERKEEDYDYSEPTLLVLDDPVSSFDLENKAGMVSLIGQQCSKILKGCGQSKVLILTHDFMTLRDLCVVREKLANTITSIGKDELGSYCELQNGIARDKDVKYIRDNNDYYIRLQNIFHYADADDPESDMNDSTMGSILRRLLEQYASFRYQKPWYELFSDVSLAGLDPSKRDAIQALYMRPVLNPESHGTEEVYQSSEIQRIARMVLAYLLLTDKTHLRSYIKGSSQLRKIEQWAEEL